MVNNNKIILERQKMQNKMKLKYSFPFLASICGEEHVNIINYFLGPFNNAEHYRGELSVSQYIYITLS